MTPRAVLTLTLLTGLTLLVACEKSDAPAEGYGTTGTTGTTEAPVIVPRVMSGLMPWLWSSFKDGSPSALGEGIQNLHEVTGAALLDTPEDGALPELTPLDLRGLSISPEPEPDSARGIYVVNTFPCTLEQLEPILLDVDQAGLYDDLYEEYDREYTSNLSAYSEGQTDTLEWDAEASVSNLLISYTQQLQGGLRYLSDTEQGPALMSRVFMTEPAEFDSDATFDQLYVIDVFYERAPGEMIHVSGQWLDMDLGGGLDMENDTMIAGLVESVLDRDERTAELCEERGG